MEAGRAQSIRGSAHGASTTGSGAKASLRTSLMGGDTIHSSVFEDRHTFTMSGPDIIKRMTHGYHVGEEIVEDLAAFPPRFLGPGIEERYRKSTVRRLRGRVAIVQWIAFVSTLTISGVVLAAWLLGLLSHQPEIVLTYLAGSVVAHLIALYGALNPRKICRISLDTFIAGCWSLQMLFASLFSGASALMINFEKVHADDHVLHYIFALGTKILVDLSTVYLLPLVSIGLCSFIQLRMKPNFILHCLYIVFLTVPQLIIAVRVGKLIPIWIETFVQIFLVFSVLFMCLIGRFYSEILDRIRFWQNEKHRATLEEAEVQLQSQQREVKASTAVEELQNLVQKSQNCIYRQYITTKSTQLGESSEILEQVLQILMRTSDLYSVKFGMDESVQPEEILMQQFVQAYQVDKGPLKKAKSVRFVSEDREPDKDEKPRAIPESIAEARIGVDWGADILQLGKIHANILTEVGLFMLKSSTEALGIETRDLQRFLFAIQSLYLDNPYHNQLHGTFVAHAARCASRYIGIFSSEYFSSMDDVAFIVGALGHDAGHPGRTNQFLSHSGDSLATIYNDVSVLENYHSCLIFRTLEKPELNILKAVASDGQRSFRRNVIDLILATDMKQHFESVTKFRIRRAAPDFDPIGHSEDMWLTLRMCLKLADLGHACTDWPVHNEWSLRVAEEFYQQGEDETSRGLPKSPLCDRHTHDDFAKSQKGFIEFVVQPLLKELEEVDVSDRIGSECVRRVVYNKYKWEEMVKEGKTVEQTKQILEMKTQPTNIKLDFILRPVAQ